MVANTADVAATRPGAGAFAQVADRWIYVFMAGLFVLTALVGFIPDSVGLLAAVDAGRRPPLPPVLHAHAVLMATWLLLLLTQTTLMATGRKARHMKLGIVAVVLVPLIAAMMIGVTKSGWSLLAAIPQGAMSSDALARTQSLLSNLLLEQIRSIVLFPGLIAWALLVRKRDPETHKRLMILATLIPLPAAIDRMDWLPGTLPDSPVSVHLYSLLWLAPALMYDIARLGRIHRAYVIGIALNLPFVIASHLLWASPWWLATAPTLMGMREAGL
jgi:hypothetical protein